ncbi:MAG: hypothetical protein IH859_08840 [Chloroflexi bacterium]|nr:hypothetical protein [Chloroflexota bacterium]
MVSGDLATTFETVSDVLKEGAHIDQIVATMVVLAGDRMARTPVNINPGWGELARVVNLASLVRTALRYGGHKVAASPVSCGLAVLLRPVAQHHVPHSKRSSERRQDGCGE